MRVVLNRVRMLEQLSKAVRVVPSHENIQVLECIYMEADTDQITIIGGDSTTYLITNMDAKHVQIQQQGKVAVHARLLYEIVRKMDEKEIILSSEAASDLLTITTISAKSTFVLKLLNADEYPLPEHIQDYTSFTIRGKSLKDSIHQTLFAVQKKENTPALTGVKMEVRDGTVIMIGCDRFRMGRVEQTIVTTTSATNEEVIIPGRAMNELEKLIVDEPVAVNVSKTKMEFTGKDFTLLTQSITGSYPNIDMSVYSAYLARFVVHASSLISALDRVAIIASQEKTNLIRMRVTAEHVEFDSSSKVNQASECLPMRNFQGAECKISFNVGYALEALKAMDVEEVQVQINKGMQMIVFTSDEKRGHCN
ncbi:DNA polymerase III subunit beta [Paenibacillus sp. PCH8]|uniref:DNA polymerase III subunit beta n=1 Tax=Paenibacillus sp. PCH8 TaxID=2066524 RepID=UPI000CF9CE22|nr:DNA polymerase III subunit beta [Paenibacillus sp. PCH8]PQP85002.1 DNA polymerase III subunit beta [Paenibacillus sp. PCH8]